MLWTPVAMVYTLATMLNDLPPAHRSSDNGIILIAGSCRTAEAILRSLGYSLDAWQRVLSRTEVLRDGSATLSRL